MEDGAGILSRRMEEKEDWEGGRSEGKEEDKGWRIRLGSWAVRGMEEERRK